MLLIGFLAGLVVGVIFLTETCPTCEAQDCGRVTAPLPLVSPERQAHKPSLPERPPVRPPVNEPKRPSRIQTDPEPRAGPEPCPDRGLLCPLLGLGSIEPQPAPGADQPGSRARPSMPGSSAWPSKPCGFDSFFEDLSDHH